MSPAVATSANPTNRSAARVRSSEKPGPRVMLASVSRRASRRLPRPGSARAVLPRQPQVAQVDQEPRALAHGEHRVALMDGVSEERGSTDGAQDPEGEGDHDTPLPLGRPPLHDEPRPEQELPGEP